MELQATNTVRECLMQARMYDPTIGRFLSQDPELIGGTALNSNPYIYCNNNPVNNIDPSGKSFFSAITNAYNKVKQVVKKAVEVVRTYNPIAVAGNKLGEVLYNKGYGDACQYMYDHNKFARYAMDHPYLVGAAVGIVAGLAAYGTVLAIQEGTISYAASRARSAYNLAMKGDGKNLQLKAGQVAHKEFQRIISKVIPGNTEATLGNGSSRVDYLLKFGKKIYELKPASSANLSRTATQLAKYRDLGYSVRLILY